MGIKQKIVKKDDDSLSKIKSVILRMFQLDYHFTGSYEEYEKEAKKIYTNTYYPVPQEALNNKLTDFKIFNMPLPSMQKESYIPPMLNFDIIAIKNNSASINIGRSLLTNRTC